jgi:hypothetical protein
MIDPLLITQARELCFEVAPELVATRTPVYVLAHPENLPSPAGARAYCPTGGTLIGLRDVLVARGEWQGPGISIVFIDPGDSTEEAMGMTLHELAHDLPHVRRRDCEPSPGQRERQTAMLVAWATDNQHQSGPLPWQDHDSAWIRRVLHLHYRALWAGRPIPLALLWAAGARYGLSPIWKYLEAIGAELFTMRNWTFREIDNSPLPVEFNRLWQHDLQGLSR